jgi:flagellar secretion chaperone FliS
MSAAANHYLRQRVETATPAQLIGMLYDAGTAAIRAGLAAMEAGDRPTRARQLLRAQDVVMELRCALNRDAGEIAANLDSLYDFAYRRLIAANVDGDPKAAQEALRVLEPLQQTWREACLGQQPATAGATT